MEDSVPLLVSILVFLVICSAFFSGTETAFSAANRVKLKHMYEGGNKKAGKVIDLIDNFDQLLSSVLIGNNIVNILATSIATVLFVGYFGNLGVSLATIVMTVVVLIFGEISPKALAKESPEKFAIAVTPVIKFFMVVFKPINYLFSKWKVLLKKIFRIQNSEAISEEELLTYVDEAKQDGSINENEQSLIMQALEFDELTSEDIFTPRVDVEAVPIDATFDEISKMYYETGFSRLPVYEESIDKIIGVLILKDFFYSLNKTKRTIKDIIRPAVYVSKTVKATELLTKLQDNHSHMAVVVDEFGGTLGIITIEDLIEELIGDIWDEHDVVVKDIIQNGPNEFKVLGGSNIEDFFKAIDEEIPEDVESTTVNGWIIELIDRFPETGEEISYGDFKMKMGKIDKNRVEEVFVRLSDRVKRSDDSESAEGNTVS